MFDYIFIALLAATWWVVFLFPAPKKSKNRARLLLALRIAGCWWVTGMAYNFLSFLVPNLPLLGLFDQVFNYTLALPVRLAISAENFRVAAFASARFDLALAMILAMPFAFLLTLGLLAAVKAAKTSYALWQRSRGVPTQ